MVEEDDDIMKRIVNMLILKITDLYAKDNRFNTSAVTEFNKDLLHKIKEKIYPKKDEILKIYRNKTIDTYKKSHIYLFYLYENNIITKEYYERLTRETWNI